MTKEQCNQLLEEIQSTIQKKLRKGTFSFTVLAFIEEDGGIGMQANTSRKMNKTEMRQFISALRNYLDFLES